MPSPATIPSTRARSVTTFTILSEGNALPASLQVKSIVVQREVNRIASATIMIQDGSAAAGQFDASNGAVLIPGKAIEIKAGYQSDEETIFKGIVIRHSLKIRKDVSMLQVECRHEATKMTTTPVSKYFIDMKDDAIAAQLCSDHGLTANTSGDALQHKEMVQWYTTDWDFMLCRAEANGAWVITGNDAISWGVPDMGQNPALTVQYGATIKEFDAEIDARLQFEGWKGNSWSAGKQEITESEATEASVPAVGNIAALSLAQSISQSGRVLRHNSLPEPELKKWADAALQKHRLAKIRGRVTVDGTALAEPGKLLELAGTGERFEGKVMITGVRHQLERGVWESIIQFGEVPTWHAERFEVSQPLAGALLPPVQGLQIGVVTDLEDPDGEDRIKVRLPLVSAAEEGAWMRLATMDAGNNRGWIYRPEIGDEVVVGFMNNDPRFGVVLGSLHSSAHAAPIPGKNDNHEKGYVSRSEMKLHFDDDKKIVTLSTPDGHSIVADDDAKSITLQDSHGNKIVMDDKGISIESIKDINLKSSEKTGVESGTGMELKAGTSFKAEGGAGAELSSGAMTAVKGSMVNIN